MLNTCCLALLDACIPLSSTFSSLTCGLTEEGELLVDPDLQQEEQCKALLTFVVDDASGDIVMSHAHGGFSIEKVRLSLYHGCNSSVFSAGTCPRTVLSNFALCNFIRAI